ncbi:hypothetical protein JOD29_003670 [Lysinibacillus composti]|uniref:Uncharacterized protein n=1 Tax=Lysinibacillus composti TaxID=720633 RepID=A0A3N9U6V3_9BACI|nr:hypothetical protein [Lysinibacillus composti]MBM7610390.1 hypothetical protein [Lysinibacillus composti]RQW72339.1 hypothetical protein EBB45_18125 [Lysinibacillus composti]
MSMNEYCSNKKREKHRLIKLLIITLLDELETEYADVHPICHTCQHKGINHENNYEHQQDMKEHKYYEESSSSTSHNKHKPSSKPKNELVKEKSNSPVVNDHNPMKILEQFDMNSLTQLSELINLMSVVGVGGKFNSIMDYKNASQDQHKESSSYDDRSNSEESSSCHDNSNYEESSSSHEDCSHEESSSSCCLQHDVESSSFKEEKKEVKEVYYENKSLRGNFRARKRRKID